MGLILVCVILAQIRMAKKDKIELWDAQHPLRQMAIRIIEEVIEREVGHGLQGERYYKIEDDLVALLSNLEIK